MKYSAKMYAHRLADNDAGGHGLCGAYDDAGGTKISDLALFSSKAEAASEAQRNNNYKDMGEVEVVEIRVTIEVCE